MYGVIDVRNKSNERDVLSLLYSKSKYFYFYWAKPTRYISAVKGL